MKYADEAHYALATTNRRGPPEHAAVRTQESGPAASTAETRAALGLLLGHSRSRKPFRTAWSFFPLYVRKSLKD